MTRMIPIKLQLLAAGGRMAVALAAMSISGCAASRSGRLAISADDRATIQRDAEQMFSRRVSSADDDVGELAGSASGAHDDFGERGEQ